MKILQINASYKPAFIYGGPTMSVSKLSEVLVSKNIHLEVLTTLANGPIELLVPTTKPTLINGVPINYHKRLTKDHTHFSPSLCYTLWKKIIESKKDKPQKLIVHIHTWWNLVSIFSCLIGWAQKVPIVLSPRGTLSNYSFGNRNNLIKQVIFAFSKPALRRCHFHATSENEKQALSKLIHPKSITVIPNLVTLPSEQPPISSRQPGQGIKLLFFSRVEQKKGLELLFSALEKCEFQYSLTIAGTGDLDYIHFLKALSKRLTINEKISWIGNQEPEIKFDIMTAHDLLVLPSHDENFANVVIESLASGTAVMITQNVGLSDYVIENDFGWVCKFDESDLRLKLRTASNDFAKLEAIRKNAPGKIRCDFSDDKVSQQYIDMYNRILQYV